MIAALFVATNGVYFGLPDVDPWDAARDARLYDGPFPVVAHPPCERWGRYATGGSRSPGLHTKGEDGGCFASALSSVRKFGGVLEHPRDTSAWSHFGIYKPSREGLWYPAGDGIGFTCCVEQGNYGHKAAKPTWLYAVGCALPELKWGKSPEWWHTDSARSQHWKERASKVGVLELLSKKERTATPIGFRDLLLSIALSARKDT